jgi:hypothetical protein
MAEARSALDAEEKFMKAIVSRSAFGALLLCMVSLNALPPTFLPVCPPPQRPATA